MKIGIIAAMDEELELLQNELTTSTKHKLLHQYFWTGTLHPTSAF